MGVPAVAGDKGRPAAVITYPDTNVSDMVATWVTLGNTT
jgi:hypothetical protein